MAVYASFEQRDFEDICARYALGSFVRAQGIPQGSINTNFHLFTSSGRYFLRHTHVRSAPDLNFEAALLSHLEEAHFPGPVLRKADNGAAYLPRSGGFVSIFDYLVGEELTRAGVTPEHVDRLGEELARLHIITNSFGQDRRNPYGPDRVRDWLDQLSSQTDVALVDIAGELLGDLETAERTAGKLVPRGIIHADLFLDNVKWVAERVSAFFDFEMACREAFTLDVAITLNAWCFAGDYDPQLCRAFLRGYQRHRPLDTNEREDLFHQALFGAVRFTVSRIRDFHLSPLPPDKLMKKDYRTYLARARALRGMGPKKFRELVGL